ncbi:MAG: hypothetical protein Q4G33_07600 [bacterium]|nr:hypothetical protein [bacterium]
MTKNQMRGKIKLTSGQEYKIKAMLWVKDTMCPMGAAEEKYIMY